VPGLLEPVLKDILVAMGEAAKVPYTAPPHFNPLGHALPGAGRDNVNGDAEEVQNGDGGEGSDGWAGSDGGEGSDAADASDCGEGLDVGGGSDGDDHAPPGAGGI